MEVKGKKVLVFGLGISGIGAGQILERHGAEVIMYDGNQKLTEEKIKKQKLFSIFLLLAAGIIEKRLKI